MANPFKTEIETPELETLADLAENVLYKLPMCGDLMIRKTLQEVYADFCRESTCLRSTIPVELRERVGNYFVPSIYGGFVESVQGVEIPPRELRENEDYVVLSGAPLRIMLAQAPRTSGDAMLVRTVEMPAPNTERVPRDVLARYGAFVVSGTVARLAGMQNRAWYLPDLAASEHKKYVDAIGSTRMRMLSGSQAGSGRVNGMDFRNVII